jgi:hypothetical protein
MVTVGYLKKRLSEIPDNAKAYAYEGEVTGIIIVTNEEPDSYTIIHACESKEIEDEEK